MSDAPKPPPVIVEAYYEPDNAEDRVHFLTLITGFGAELLSVEDQA